MGQQLKVSSDRLAKQGIEPIISDLQGEWFIHNKTAAPLLPVVKFHYSLCLIQSYK